MRCVFFSDEEVRDLIAGRKTQFRRPVTALVDFNGGMYDDQDDPIHWGYWVEDGYGRWAVLEQGIDEGWQHGSVSIQSPYGRHGSHIYVREAWCPGDRWVSTPDYDCDPPEVIRYRADNAAIRYPGDPDEYVMDPADVATWSSPKRWHSPVTMPRWAARFELEITDVRCERVKAVTKEDAVAEGVYHDRRYWIAGTHPVKGTGQCWATPYDAVKRMWEERYDKKHPWHKNPFAWIVTFRRVERRVETQVVARRADDLQDVGP